MDYNKIKLLIKERGISVKEFAPRVSMTPSGFHQMVQNKTLTVETLDLISKELGVTITSWWEDQPSADKEEIAELKKKIEYLERINMNLLDQVEEFKSQGEVKKEKSKRAG